MTAASLSFYLNLWISAFISNIEVHMMSFQALFLETKAKFGKKIVANLSMELVYLQ